MYRLQLFDLDDPLRPLDARLVREGRLRIGRDPAADWSIADDDLTLSRIHCEIEADRDGITLIARGANGVFDDANGDRFPDGDAVRLPLPATVRLGRFRLVVALAPQSGAGNEHHTIALTPPLGTSLDVPVDWTDAPIPPAPREGSLLDAFCEGAGLDGSQLTGDEPAEVMRRAGAVYRQMVLGVADLMAERERARGHYQLTRTTIGGTNNNPFKWAPTQRLAIDLLLDGSAGFLSGPAALQASFRDIKRHLVATFAGQRAALQEAIDSFDPAALDRAVEGRGGSFLKGRGSLIAEEAATRHADLSAQVVGRSSGSLDRAFVAAYDAAEAETGRG